jgi:Tfp pilus assembly protein PilF
MRARLQEKVNHPCLSPEDVPLGMSATRGVLAAFDLSWDNLKPEVQYLACILGTFAAASIDWNHVESLYAHLPGETCKPDDLIDRWLHTLLRLHLVRSLESGIYDLHPLVRDYFALQLHQHPHQSQIQAAFYTTLAEVAETVEDSATLALFSRLEPHLRKAITLHEDREDEQLAACLNGLGILYRSQGEYSEAKTFFKKSLEIRERQLSADHPDVATSLNNLALLYRVQGKYGEAEPLYRRSLEIDKRTYGEDHPEVATDLNNLAGLYRAQGKYGEAESLYRRTIEIDTLVYGENHLEVAIDSGNLAQLYSVQKRYSEAESLFQKAIPILEAALGSTHPRTIKVKENYTLMREAMAGES